MGAIVAPRSDPFVLRLCGAMFQISLAYWRIVRSAEKTPCRQRS